MVMMMVIMFSIPEKETDTIFNFVRSTIIPKELALHRSDNE